MATKPSRTDTVGKIKIKVKRVQIYDGSYRWHVLHPYSIFRNGSFTSWREAMNYALMLVPSVKRRQALKGPHLNVQS